MAPRADDYGNNVSAQMAYTARSKAWYFPAPYYSFAEHFHLGGRQVEVLFVMVDTVILSAGTSWGFSGEAERRRAEDHWAWLEEQLSGASADYVVVGGHYPVWSVGHHGPTGILVDRLRPMLIAHGVSVYIAGHDHDAQALQESGVCYHGVGGAHLLNEGAPNTKAVPEGSLIFHFGGNIWPANIYKGAFASLALGPAGEYLAVTHWDSDGSRLQRVLSSPRRPQSS